MTNFEGSIKLFKPSSEQYYTLLNQIKQMIRFWLLLKEKEHHEPPHFLDLLFFKVQEREDHLKHIKINQIKQSNSA